LLAVVFLVPVALHIDSLGRGSSGHLIPSYSVLHVGQKKEQSRFFHIFLFSYVEQRAKASY